MDFLAVCAHPDDFEVGISGIFLKAKKEGINVGLIVMTMGESGGYATAETRIAEGEASAKILGLDYYRQLSFPDAGLRFSDDTIKGLIPYIRECSPRIIFTLHPEDYHPDHRAISQVVDAAAFSAGLKKYSTDGSDWHYDNIFYFSADGKTNRKRPDILVDISDVIDNKIKACNAHKSQNITEMAIDMSKEYGKYANVEYAEGLYIRQPLVISTSGALLK